MKKLLLALLPAAAITALALPFVAARTAKLTPASSKVQHIVVQFNENQSFDHFMGDYCKTTTRATPCNVDASSGQPFDVAAPVSLKDSTGATQTITPFVGPDLSPAIDHRVVDLKQAIATQWLKIAQCTPAAGAKCFGYLTAAMVPNAANMANLGTISDATYSSNPVPSWNGHSDLVNAGQLYGFTGDNPGDFTNGWGCDSQKKILWRPNPGAPTQTVPSCFPDKADMNSSNPNLFPFGGAFQQTPVQDNVPTLMRDMDAHGITWKMYGASKISDDGYQWSICPTFASCLDTSEKSHLVSTDQFFTDAASGKLPQVSFILPGPSSRVTGSYSQHNGNSVMVGENMSTYIYNALFSGPNGSTSVLEKTWDDCGCFYDHATPTPIINGQQAGVRVPAIFVGPSVKAGYTDSTPANFSSTMAMIEWLTGLPPIGGGKLPDATAYNYHNIFNFAQTSTTFKPLKTQSVSPAELKQIQANPVDPNDPS